MSIRDGIQSILENKLDLMKENFEKSLTLKAVEKLDERKIQIAQNCFAQKK